MIFNLTYKSILNRKTAFFLSVFSIAISVVLLLGIQRVAKSSEKHFLNTLNETDMIVGASNGSIEILLNLVFHIGDGLGEMQYSSYEEIATMDEVAWSVPLSLGDSFRGFEVMATNEDFFKRYKYASGKLLEFQEGGNFGGFYDVIVGFNVHKKLDLKLSDKVHLSHADEHHEHTNREFSVSGILKPSNTPNDDLVFIQLKSDEAIHLEWQSGHFVDMHIESEKLSQMDIKLKHVSGMLLGLKNPLQILELENKINHYKGENLKAVIPAKALSKLFKLMQSFQNVLFFISVAVFIVALFTMLTSMYATLIERRREIAILRSLGASAKVLFALFAIESFLIVACGIVLGVFILTLLIALIPSTLSISHMPDIYEIAMLLVMVAISLLASLIPALSSYKQSLQDGLIVKI
ncbi:MAG: FtsX-like permease family protein [Campylobacterales bacterium]|nr:FtsX-like permease family protein [Campylobacterales bacterium]